MAFPYGSTESVAPPDTSATPFNCQQERVPRDAETDLVHPEPDLAQHWQWIRRLHDQTTKCNNDLRELTNNVPLLQKELIELEEERQGLLKPCGKEPESQHVLPNEEVGEGLVGLDRIRRDFHLLKHAGESLQLQRKALGEAAESLDKLQEEFQTGLQKAAPAGASQSFSVSESRKTRVLQRGLGEIRSRLKAVDSGVWWLEKVAPTVSTRIFDLTGSIRTFCRIRERQPGIGGSSVEIVNRTQLKVNSQPTNCFHFDRVFGPGTADEEIFEKLRPYIQGVLDGADLCLFYYGPTDAGTMPTTSGNKECKIERVVLFPLIKNFLHLAHNTFNGFVDIAKLTMSSFNTHGYKARDCLKGEDLHRVQAPLQEEPVVDIDTAHKLLHRALEDRQRLTYPPRGHWGVQLTLIRDGPDPNISKFTLIDLAKTDWKESNQGTAAQDGSVESLQHLHTLRSVLHDNARKGKAKNVQDSTVSYPSSRPRKRLPWRAANY